MKKIYTIGLVACLYASTALAQGMLNEGARLVVADGAYLVAAGGSAAAYTSQNNGQITLGGTIQLEGNWVNNNSTLSAILSPTAAANTVFAGTQEQTIGGSYAGTNSFGNMVVQSGASVRVPAGKFVTLSGTLATNNAFTIESNASGNGSLKTSGAVTGTAKVQLYIPEGGRYYYISTPIANPTGATLKASTTGYKLYNNKVTSTAATWVQMSNSSILYRMRGYAFSIPAPETFTFDGTLSNTSSYSITINYVTTLADDAGLYTLVGNPYPCSLDWKNSTGFTFTNVYNFIHYRNLGANSWVTYNRASNVGTNGGTRYIPPMQGFYVKARQAGTFTIKKAARVHNSQSLYKTTTNQPDDEAVVVGVRLRLTQNDQSDEMVVAFSNQATKQYDDFDADKMLDDANFGLYSYTSNKEVCINVFSEITNNEHQPLTVMCNTNGLHTIEMEYINNFDPTVPVYIEDRTTGTLHDLRSGSYTFAASAGVYNNRFVLHFAQSATSTTQANNNELHIYGYQQAIYVTSVQQAQISVFDVMGRLVKSEQHDGNQNVQKINIDKAGVYTVLVTSQHAVTTQKIALL